MDKDESLNIFNEPLLICSKDPVTGFFRDCMCNTCKEDTGSHTICVEATEEFLEYSKLQGNDLSTPRPESHFAGLRPGDHWCLCAARWLEAYKDNKAPKVYLTRTHIRALEIVPLEILRKFAADLN